VEKVSFEPGMKQWMCDGGWEWWAGGRWIRECDIISRVFCAWPSFMYVSEYFYHIVRVDLGLSHGNRRISASDARNVPGTRQCHPGHWSVWVNPLVPGSSLCSLCCKIIQPFYMRLLQKKI